MTVIGSSGMLNLLSEDIPQYTGCCSFILSYSKLHRTLQYIIVLGSLLLTQINHFT